MAKLQTLLLLMAPFVLVALYHHISFTHTTTGSLSGAPRMALIAAGRRRGGLPGWRPPIDEAALEPIAPVEKEPPAEPPATEEEPPPITVHKQAAPATTPEHVLEAPLRAKPAESATQAAPRRVLETKHYDPPLLREPDPSVHWPDPTLSPKKLLDGSQNWLPVPNAEGESPDDLAWRRELRPGMAPPNCPKGRRPYHTILTAQASTYQEWQTKIMHYHFRKMQKEHPCTEMTGFTRLLVSNNGATDGLMSSMPTLVVPQLGFDTTKGFQVINRPWSLREVLKQPGWAERVQEQYVYVAETDHLILQDIPNRATPKLNVAFFFPYMSPVPPQQAAVVKRYYEGNHLEVQPVGPSPAMMHVGTLKRLAPLWYDLSVELKRDRTADAAFGWVLEMWGYSIACARLGIKNFVWQQLQIEPSSTWHQNISAEDPMIYHYTFGVEYAADGIPVVGAVGEWSLDKRHYFGGYPPRNLAEPPKCALECAWVWSRMFNEATDALFKEGQWPESTSMGGTLSFGRAAGAGKPANALTAALIGSGPWIIDGKHKPLLFFRNNRAEGPWGLGSWWVESETTATLQMCSDLTLTFDSTARPTSFTYTKAAGGRMRGSSTGAGKGALDPAYASMRVWKQPHDAHPAVAELLGYGPWAWSGITPMAFLQGGALHSPWGTGSYWPLEGSTDTVVAEFVGSKHRITAHGCMKFSSVREGDGEKVEGWVQMGQKARGCQL